MDPSVIVGLIVSAVAPKVLELLKAQRWAMFIQSSSPRLNRFTAVVLASLTTIGVTMDYDATAGTLLIAGLLPGQMLSLGVTWIVNFAVQEIVYRKFVNRPPDYVGPRGLVVLLLAAGLTASCATAIPAALTVEKSVRTTIVTVSEKVEPLVCSPEARQVLTNAPCLHLLDHLEPATEIAITYNRTLASGQLPNIAAMTTAIKNLIAAVRSVVPDGAEKTSAIADLEGALARAEGGR